jgi:hypothetical protein
MIPVSVDGTPLVGSILSEGHLLLNLNVFDEYNQSVLRIVNNELLYTVSSWDIELLGRNLVIRESRGNFLIDMTFEVPSKLVINRGKFFHNGVEIITQPDHILVTNNRFLISGCQALDCPGGPILGPHSQELGGSMSLQTIPRYPGDRVEAERWARESLRASGKDDAQQKSGTSLEQIK